MPLNRYSGGFTQNMSSSSVQEISLTGDQKGVRIVFAGGGVGKVQPVNVIAPVWSQNIVVQGATASQPKIVKIQFTTRTNRAFYPGDTYYANTSWGNYFFTFTKEKLAEQLEEIKDSFNSQQSNFVVSINNDGDLIFTGNTNNFNFNIYFYMNVKKCSIPVAPFQAFEMETPMDSMMQYPKHIRVQGMGVWEICEIT